MFDRDPPGQQPQMSTVTALMELNRRILARQKAVKGMMPNWDTIAMATPFGFMKWDLILERSIVQPRDIIVTKRTKMVAILRDLFRGLFGSMKLVFLETFSPR